MDKYDLSSLIIRKFVPATDRQGVERCFVELQDFSRAHDARLPSGGAICADYIARLEQECVRYEGEIFIAEVGGELAGYVCVLASLPTGEPADGPLTEARIVDLVVMPKLRGAGLGRRLLDRAEAHAMQAGAHWLRVDVFAWNEDAAYLYESSGFTKHETVWERAIGRQRREKAQVLAVGVDPKVSAMKLVAVKALRADGAHERARDLVLSLLQAQPNDAELHLEAARISDFLGDEADAIPHYVAALGGDLTAAKRLNAHVGLGSSLRTVGRYIEAESALQIGNEEFPQASELRVFLAMTMHNLGRSAEAVESLLALLAETSNDAGISKYRQALLFYAQDINRTWS